MTSGTETRQRTDIVAARVLPEEKATVLAAAARLGVHEAELVRDAALTVAAVVLGERPPGCRCRQPGVALHLACPKHSPYRDVRRGLSVEDAQAIAEDVARERAEDAADREERSDEDT